MRYAKPTRTVQRFKIHLITQAGEDYFTKIKFSRRGFDSPHSPEAIDSSVLAQYLLPPLIVPHYLAGAAVRQKINAVLSRRQTEAKDIFDLYILSTRISNENEIDLMEFSPKKLKEAQEKIYSVDFGQYRDKVISFLSPEDQAYYDSKKTWDEIRLKVVSLLEKGVKKHG